jgi:hypothetical protein
MQNTPGSEKGSAFVEKNMTGKCWAPPSAAPAHRQSNVLQVAKYFFCLEL